MVNHTEIQYEKGHSCERTDAPADQGCLVKKGSQLDFDNKSCLVQLNGLITTLTNINPHKDNRI